jgi:hypothetical protein
MIQKCGCKYKFQDELYGEGMRVHTEAPKAGKYSCTVCGSTKAIGGAKVEGKKKK